MRFDKLLPSYKTSASKLVITETLTLIFNPFMTEAVVI